jgi:hypothetical protein
MCLIEVAIVFSSTVQEAPGTAIEFETDLQALRDRDTWETNSRSRFRCEVVKKHRDDEDDVDAVTPMDAKNASTGVWKSRPEREIPTASTSIAFSLRQEDEERRGEHPRSTVH